MISQNSIIQYPDSLAEDIEISMNSNSLPLTSSLSKLGRCIVCYCLQGMAEVEVNLIRHRFVKSEIMVLFPTQIVEQKEVSPDFSVMYFSISPAMLQEVCFRIPPDFLTFLRQHFYYKVTADSLQEEMVRFNVIQRKFSDVENCCRREIMLNLFRIFFLELYDKLRRDELTNSTSSHNRKTVIFEEFIHLVMRYFKIKRDVNFYAETLFISPKYLSMITMEICGYGAKQWIDDYVILELKIRLKSTRDSIQKITNDLNFPDQAFLCKYFKMRTGLSPSEYRKK
jgi:AraC-like DNA-binding protein